MFAGKEKPFVQINGAVSADGKLALENLSLIQFSSSRDRNLVFVLRSGVDAVLSGATTVETFSIDLAAGGPQWRRKRVRRGLSAEPLRVIVSDDADFDPQSCLLKKGNSPVILLTTARAPTRRVRALEKAGVEVIKFGKETVSFAPAFRWLRDRHGVNRIVCEGGGITNAALLRASVVDEVHITLCPLVLRGATAPTICDSAGFTSRLKLKSARPCQGEIFLIYQVQAGAERRSRIRPSA